MTFKIGDIVESQHMTTRGSIGVIIGRSDFPGNWMVKGFKSPFEQGEEVGESYHNCYLKLVRRKHESTKDYNLRNLKQLKKI